MKQITAFIFFAIAALFVTAAQAGTPKEIKWQDLIPKSIPIINPLTELTPDQTIDFDTLIAYRNDGGKNPFGIASPLKGEAEEATRRLKKQGIDINNLLTRWDNWQSELEKAGEQLVENLDGQTIRMAGYLMPLEFNEEGETEFLLVPYVGACIHVPPPPPNQLVFVSSPKPFKVTDVYTPVWITGILNTKRTSQSLNLADGSAKVPVGYKMASDKIEHYNK